MVLGLTVFTNTILTVGIYYVLYAQQDPFYIETYYIKWVETSWDIKQVSFLETTDYRSSSYVYFL